MCGVECVSLEPHPEPPPCPDIRSCLPPSPRRSPDLRPPPPCAAIRQVCLNAGFVMNGARAGEGLIVDCVRPIMQGTPQPARASKPLPAVDPALVEACRAQNPGFGMRNAQAPQAAPQRNAPGQPPQAAPGQPPKAPPGPSQDEPRSEERRVGKECR